MEILNNSLNKTPSEALLAAIVESSDDAIISKTLDGIITSWNNGAEKIYGYSPTEIIGKHVSILVPSDITNEISRLLDLIGKGQRILNFETLRLKKDKSVFTASITISPIVDSQGQIIGASTITRDITRRKAMELELRRAGERFRTMFEEHQAIMLLIDPENGQIFDANPAALNFYGYSREALRKMKITDINQLKPDQTKTDIDKAVNKAQSYFIFPHKLASGEICTVEVYSSPINLNSKRMLFSIIHDVTSSIESKKELEASEKRYRNLFESMDEGCALCEMIYDLQGKPIDFRYLMVNPAFAKLTGLSLERVVGHTVKEVIPGIEQFWIDNYDQVIQSGLSQRIQNPVKELDKMLEVFAWRADPKRFAVVFSDVSEQREMEEKIERLYKKEKIQRQKLEEEARVKSLFIDILAHELRNPLTSVLSSSGILLDAQNISEEMHKRLAANINNGATTLAKRLDELLDVARFSKGTFELQKQPIDPKIFIEDVVERFKPALIKKNQHLELSIRGKLPAVTADQSRLEQVIVNILSNASKYSAENSRIWLTVKIKGSKLLVEVKDEGVGIAEEDAAEIFQAYHRIGRTARTPGVGLGLYISKQIINAHGGKIWVTSQPGQGSTFSFLIPLTQPEK